MMPHDDSRLARAQGCMLGQLAGDSLGGLVEFATPEAIRARYPGGVRDLADGGPWKLLAGQPTDDSEMALLLARMLVREGRYSPEAAYQAYSFWLASGPFTCGATIRAALQGRPNPESQANGALMRVSPLGIFGAAFESAQVAAWAGADAALTHPHPVCIQANSLYAMAVAKAVRTRQSPEELYASVLSWTAEMDTAPALAETVRAAAARKPVSYTEKQGWVLIAFQNALWQLLHAATPEEGIMDTVMQGGDTDTNAAICGALLGAVHGREAIPRRWVDVLLRCRPVRGAPGVHHPRPEIFWPVDALELAGQLLAHA